jgi:hypothetical protein
MKTSGGDVDHWESSRKGRIDDGTLQSLRPIEELKEYLEQHRLAGFFRKSGERVDHNERSDAARRTQILPFVGFGQE